MMPQNIIVAAFIFGAVLVLIALVGGGFKLFGVEIPAITGSLVRIVAGVAGTSLIFIGIYGDFYKTPKSPEPTSQLPPPTQGIPEEKVCVAEDQHKLFEKNYECLRKPPDGTITKDNVRTDSTLCASGDILLHIKKAPGFEDKLHWVSSTTFRLENASAISLIQDAIAANWKDNQTLAQDTFLGDNPGTPRVLCQQWLQQGYILRTIQYPTGHCFAETINTYTGEIISRVLTPCDNC
jgi:hypothetical protein